MASVSTSLGENKIEIKTEFLQLSFDLKKWGSKYTNNRL